MRNKQYWIDRANGRMDNYTLAAFDTARTIQRSYNTLETYIKTEIAKILRNVGDEGTLAYEYRMKRLNALLINTEQKFKELYGINLGDTTAFLKSIIPEAYYHTIFDIAQGTGVQPEFSAVPTRLINKIINEDWSGENYSKRIWSNTEELAKEVRQVLTEAAVNGESIYKTSKRLSEKFDQSAYNSQRLIRTETTYATNQAELLSYEELDIDKYEFVATLDTRTSSICQKMDGKVFKTSDAQAGKNLPAMHPNCRSTTIPYFKEGTPDFRTARDKDGKRITVPASMKYPEWYDKYVKPYEKEKKPRKQPAPSKGKPVEVPAVTPAEVQVSKAERPENAYTAEKINRNSLDISTNNDIIEVGHKLGMEGIGDVNSYPIEENSKSVEDFKEFVSNSLGIKYIEGIDMLKNGTSANEIVNAVNELASKYGKKYSQIEIYDGGDKREIAESILSKLRLNAQYMNRPTALQDLLNKWEETNYIPKGCNSTKYVGEHEYYHFLYNSDIDNPKSKINTLLNRYSSDGGKYISDNSRDNKHEFVSDLLCYDGKDKEANKLKKSILALKEPL